MLEISTISLIFSLGIFTSLSPCLFPILPSYVGYLVHSDHKIAKGLLTSVLVLAGIMTVFMIAGVITIFITKEILGFFQDNFFQFAALQGVLLVFFGLLLILGFSLNIDRIYTISGLSQEKIQRIENPYTTSYLIGLGFAIFAAPCALIYFITVFVIAAGETIINSAILMLAFSLGAGVPFFIIGVIIPLLKQFSNDLTISTASMSKRANQFNIIFPRIAGILIFFVGLVLIIDPVLFQRFLPTL